MNKKVLLAGESWMNCTTHVKGFDSSYTPVYETGEKWLRATLEEGGYEVTLMSNHLAGGEFPFATEELKKYGMVVLSDIGASTLFLPSAIFIGSEKKPSRHSLIRDYVLDEGALMMVGGYLTLSGVDVKGKQHDITVQQVPPVEVLTADNRMEHCKGATPVTVTEHEILNGTPRELPKVLGYNKTITEPEAVMAAVIDDDPSIAFGIYGRGKSAVVTADCAPHWAPLEFCEQEYYNRIWQGIMD